MLGRTSNALKEWTYLIKTPPPIYKEGKKQWEKLNKVRRKLIWNEFYKKSQQNKDKYFNLFKKKGQYWDFDFKALEFKKDKKQKKSSQSQSFRQKQPQEVALKFEQSKVAVDPQPQRQTSTPMRIVNKQTSTPLVTLPFTPTPTLQMDLPTTSLPTVDFQVSDDEVSDEIDIPTDTGEEKKNYTVPLLIGGAIVSLVVLKALK